MNDWELLFMFCLAGGTFLVWITLALVIWRMRKLESRVSAIIAILDGMDIVIQKLGERE